MVQWLAGAVEIALYLRFNINNKVSRYRVRESWIDYAVLLDEINQLVTSNHGLVASHLIGNLGLSMWVGGFVGVFERGSVLCSLCLLLFLSLPLFEGWNSLVMGCCFSLSMGYESGLVQDDECSFGRSYLVLPSHAHSCIHIPCTNPCTTTLITLAAHQFIFNRQIDLSTEPLSSKRLLSTFKVYENKSWWSCRYSCFFKRLAFHETIWFNILLFIRYFRWYLHSIDLSVLPRLITTFLSTTTYCHRYPTLLLPIKTTLLQYIPKSSQRDSHSPHPIQIHSSHSTRSSFSNTATISSCYRHTSFPVSYPLHAWLSIFKFLIYLTRVSPDALRHYYIRIRISFQHLI